MKLDTSRHDTVFDASKFHGRIGVVGLGSLGSAVALQLAKLGLGDKMNLFDFDDVEPHNLANQVLYGPADIGLPKVTVAAMMLDRLTGGIPRVFYRKVEEGDGAMDVTHLFVCVDSMAARETIFSKCVWMKPQLEYFADGRMGTRQTFSYGFDPRNMSNSKKYRDMLYPDSDVEKEVGGCGFTLSIGATAMMLACQMTWNFIRHTSFKTDGNEQRPYHEFIFDASTSNLMFAGNLS